MTNEELSIIHAKLCDIQRSFPKFYPMLYQKGLLNVLGAMQEADIAIEHICRELFAAIRSEEKPSTVTHNEGIR